MSDTDACWEGGGTQVSCGAVLLPAGDMFNPEDKDAGEEPDWLASEREQFAEFRDKNKDGKMDREETLDWILPSGYDNAEAEAKHLVHEADADEVSTGLTNHSRAHGHTPPIAASCLRVCLRRTGSSPSRRSSTSTTCSWAVR